MIISTDSQRGQEIAVVNCSGNLKHKLMEIRKSRKCEREVERRQEINT
jgi:hypothetical protein